MEIVVNGFGGKTVMGLVGELAAADWIDRIYWIHDDSQLIECQIHGKIFHIDHVVALRYDTTSLPKVDGTTVWTDEILKLYEQLKPTIIKMQERLDRYGPLRSYAQREKTYRQLFGYWFDFLVERRIAYFIGNNVPHEITDFIIAELCRTLGIPTLCFYQWTPDVLLPVSNYRDLGDQTTRPFSPLSPSNQALIHQNYLRIEQQQRGGLGARLFYMDKRKVKRQSDQQREHWRQRVKRKIRANYGGLFSFSGLRYAYYLLVEKPFVRVWKDRRYHKEYCSYSNPAPDLSLPYIYLALHYQPEATTSPLGGMFVDQYLMVDVLLAAYPPEVHIYIKEHPAQGWVGRYQGYHKLFASGGGRAQFVSTEFSSDKLQRSALAVATVSGTVGFESIWKGTPVLHFGEAYYGGGPHVYRIRSIEEGRISAQKVMQLEEEDPRSRATEFTERLLMRALPANGSDYYHQNSILGLDAAHSKGVILQEILARLTSVL